LQNAKLNVVYACVDNLRYRTRSELNAYKRLGCDVVGSFGAPEAILARQLGLCYAMLCLVVGTDEPSPKALKELKRALSERVVRVVRTIPGERRCNCSSPESASYKELRFL
jgi:purine nucleoside phosphorylase